MQLPLWIGLCLSAAFLFRTRVRLLLGAVLGLWFLVPAVGSSVLTGVLSGPLAVHAATWLVLSIFLVRMLHDPRSVQLALARHFLLFLTLFLVMAAAFMASATSPDGGGIVLLVDQIAVPVLFFLVLLSEATRGGGLVQLLRALLLSLVALVCVIAVAQWLTGNVLFYESGFRTQYWFGRNSGRWMATLDQVLALSLVICVAAPLVAGLKRLWLQVALLALMAVGMLICQSRVGLAALAVVTVATLLWARRPGWVKVATLLPMAGAAAAIMASPLVAGVAGRVADDSGSGQARGLALDYFLSRWNDYAVAGLGIGSSYRVAVQAGLETSFENPILMYSIDFGLLFAFLYFGSMVVLVVRSGFRNGYPGLPLAGVMAVVIPQTYSSLATRSAAGIVVWTVLAMVVIATDEARERARPERRPAHVPAVPALPEAAPPAGGRDALAPPAPG
ncbi:MAG: O-antigen ligase like rane protein [Arthrobacter sp.]|nr:O-antigen ligase like rane protein [Arthrobacter sp.]